MNAWRIYTRNLTHSRKNHWYQNSGLYPTWQARIKWSKILLFRLKIKKQTELRKQCKTFSNHFPKNRVVFFFSKNCQKIDFHEKSWKIYLIEFSKTLSFLRFVIHVKMLFVAFFGHLVTTSHYKCYKCNIFGSNWYRHLQLIICNKICAKFIKLSWETRFCIFSGQFQGHVGCILPSSPRNNSGA